MDKLAVADWKISDIWNNLTVKENTAKPRDYIRASEIGKPFLDRYLAMKGVQSTNPFEARILRVFDTGYVFEVDVVEKMFKLLGLLQDAQKEVVVMLPGSLKVVGHFDHKIGGPIDVEKAKKEIYDPNTSPWMRRRALQLLDSLVATYPNGLKTLIADVKTVNSMAFWAHKNQDPQTGFFKGYDHHKLQLLTYLIAEKEAEGRLFYISKDDLTLMEAPVSANDITLRQIWQEDIYAMTKYYNNNQEPPKEDDIIFNERKNVWEFNWAVMRSPYFSLITGKKTVDEWQMALKEELKTKNSAECKVCHKVFQLMTLNKNDGVCARCFKKNGTSTN